MNEDETIKNGKYFSGEMFDLTATSFNNVHGKALNIAVMRYGINLPLSKFIDELKKIMASTQDDKSDKRAHRLNFLISCNACPEVALLFTLFCNYLNGGGKTSTLQNWTNEQYENYMVITAAGGNIIILFAHLLANMIDSFTHMVNIRDHGTGPDWKWDIKSSNPVYKRESFLSESGDLQYATYANEMFSKSFDELKANDNYLRILTITFNDFLTTTNQKLLTVLSAIQSRNTKEEMCFIIVRHFLQANMVNPELLENLYNVAQSNISDFDFKLSPNIHPSFRGDTRYGSLVDTIVKLGLKTKDLEDPEYTEDLEDTEDIEDIEDPKHAGFLLLRVKTLIDCNAAYRLGYTSTQLKDFKLNCYSNSSIPPEKIKSLFPQVMQEFYLSETPYDSDCWKYLNELWKKKHAIGLATRYAIDEIVKFQMVGYSKQSNPQGDKTYLVPPALNVTEAVINYIMTITNGLNLYIETWEKNTLTPYGAPALHEGGLPQNFSYESVCGNFKSLSSILQEDNGLVSRLACDIINYFLNYPTFNTELILDNLIVSFNKKKKELTGDESAIMNPSSLTLAPTHPDFNASLRNIKRIFKITQETRLGYPDGIRITINAIKSDTEIGDTQLDNVESAALQATTGANIKPAYILLKQKSELGAGLVKTSRVPKVGVQKLRVKKTNKTKKTKKSRKVKKVKRVNKANKVKISRKVKGTNKVKISRKANKVKISRKVKKN